MVQARLLRKKNPDAHYANAVYKFLKQWAVKNQNNVAFLALMQSATFQSANQDFPLLL